MRWIALSMLVACGSADADPGPRSQAPEGFWDHWGDGKAELDGYQLVQPRYGELRSGEAVWIFVTETFTEATRVKSDGKHDDEFPVVKLNDVRHFQTGIYDYDLMTSVFVRLDGKDPLGVPTKVDLGSQEWCGNLYDQLVFDDGSAHRLRHSYFDGEADVDSEIDTPKGGLVADALPLLVRGMAGELVKPGETIEVPFLPQLLDARLSHGDLEWITATIARSGSTENVTVPAGTFAAETWTITARDKTITYWVEKEEPRRIVRWLRSDLEEGKLTGTIRDEYWKHHSNGDDAMRKELGLP